MQSTLWYGELMVNQHDLLPVTLNGKLELATELACLRLLREQAAVEQRKNLRAHGLADPGVVAQSAEIAALDREVSRLEAALARADLVADATRQVGIGSRVWLKDEYGEERVVTVVGPLAANPHSQLISYESALGRSLLGRTAGDRAEVHSFGEVAWVEIQAVEEMPNTSLDELTEDDPDATPMGEVGPAPQGQ